VISQSKNKKCNQNLVGDEHQRGARALPPLLVTDALVRHLFQFRHGRGVIDEQVECSALAEPGSPEGEHSNFLFISKLNLFIYS